MMSVLRQAGFTAILSFICTVLGFTYTWPSPTVTLFASINTTLNRPMTSTELSFFGSLASIAALFSTPFTGFLLEMMGRKYTCMLLGLPLTVTWTIISTSNSVVAVLSAMCVSGLGSCLLVVVPMFICEFCEENIRGMMSSATIIFYGLGILLSYTFGGCLEYRVMNYLFLSLSVFGLGLLTFLKESPTHLMKKGLEEDAAKSVAFYRGAKLNSKIVIQEIDKLKRALNPQFERQAGPEERMLKEQEQKETLSFFKFMKKSRSSRQALLLCIILYTVAIFQGLLVVQVYAQHFFKEALPNISSLLTSIIFALIVIISVCVSGYFIEKSGRRFMLISSSLAVGVCCILLGTQIQLHWGSSWITAILIYTYCIAYSLGPGTIPIVIAAEIFLPEIKGIVMTLVFEWAWICNFTLLFIFHPLEAAIGIGPIFYFFGCFAFTMSVYCFFFLPETKGVPVDVIQTLFVRKSNTIDV